MRKGAFSQANSMDESIAVNRASANVFEDYQKHNSASQVSTEIAIISSLRGRYPDWEVTVTPAYPTNLLAFAQAGQAEAKLDTKAEDFSAWRIHSPSSDRTSQNPGVMSDHVLFGKYDYTWKDQAFIVYSATFQQGHGQAKNHYVLHKRGHELIEGRCKVTDDLIAAAAQWSNNVHNEVLVFDQEMWTKSTELFSSVQSSSWDDVIMNEDMKETLVKDVEGFFDSREEYEEFLVPWKRGIIFHGLPGVSQGVQAQWSFH